MQHRPARAGPSLATHRGCGGGERSWASPPPALARRCARFAPPAVAAARSRRARAHHRRTRSVTSSFFLAGPYMPHPSPPLPPSIKATCLRRAVGARRPGHVAPAAAPPPPPSRAVRVGSGPPERAACEIASVRGDARSRRFEATREAVGWRRRERPSCALVHRFLPATFGPTILAKISDHEAEPRMQRSSLLGGKKRPLLAGIDRLRTDPRAVRGARHGCARPAYLLGSVS